MLWCWHVFVRVCDVFIRSSLPCKDWVKLGSPWPKTRQCRIERQDVVEDRSTRCLKMFEKRHEVFAPSTLATSTLGGFSNVISVYQRDFISIDSISCLHGVGASLFRVGCTKKLSLLA